MGADRSEGKKRGKGEKLSGGYAPLPWAVLDSESFRQASHHARALLLELLRQWDFNGVKNGHYHLSTPWLEGRGWKSRDVIQRAKKELLDLEIIVETRKGGLNRGASRYAITWHPISDFNGLDILRSDFIKGGYAKRNKLSVPSRGPSVTAQRNSAGPPSGIVTPPAVPPGGPKVLPFARSSVPPGGHNEMYLPIPDALPARPDHEAFAEACGF